MRKLGLTVSQLNVGFALVTSLATACCSRAGAPEPAPRSAAGSPSPSFAAPAVNSASSTTEPLQPEPAKVYDDKTTSIDLSLGARFAIHLPANITTPYKWVVAPSDSDPIVVLMERHYEDKPPANCPSCVGYPGTDTLTFETKAVGTSTLKLLYAPIRSKAEPAERELTIRVTVKKN